MAKKHASKNGGKVQSFRKRYDPCLTKLFIVWRKWWCWEERTAPCNTREYWWQQKCEKTRFCSEVWTGRHKSGEEVHFTHKVVWLQEIQTPIKRFYL